jgi:hypothetical protein
MKALALAVQGHRSLQERRKNPNHLESGRASLFESDLPLGDLPNRRHPDRAIAAPDKKLRRVGTFRPRSRSMSSLHHPWWPFRSAGCLTRAATSLPTMSIAIAQDCARLRRWGAGRSGWQRAAWGSADAGEGGGSAATGSGELIGRVRLPATISCRVQILRLGSSVTDPGDRCTICEGFRSGR